MEKYLQNSIFDCEKETSCNAFSSHLDSLIASGNLKGWQGFFEGEREKEYFKSLESFLNEEYHNHVVFPPCENVFSAFTICDSADISTVILGQDPYHERGQAVGLAFSVEKSCKIPPSLRNIYKELFDNLSVRLENGDISHWARQGFFLLNTVLTVREGEANSHAKRGWEIFTRNAIAHISACENQLLFLLFGKPAEKFEGVILENAKLKHHIIKTAHPSPLSAYRGFLGSGVFKSADEILRKMNRKINWDITD